MKALLFPSYITSLYYDMFDVPLSTRLLMSAINHLLRRHKAI